MMLCTTARLESVSLARGRLVPADVRAHVRACSRCAAAIEVELVLDEQLRRLPRHAMPLALRARLERIGSVPRRRTRRRGAVVAALAALVTIIVAVVALHDGGRDPLQREAVNDHLRVVYSDHPLEVVAADMHAVKPWFTGRLAFAPVLTFTGDAQFALLGGAVGVFADRKCAVFAWQKRLHRITLIVVPADGLSFPVIPRAGRERGFATLVWLRGDLGYALVSDIDVHDLETLRTRLDDTTP